MAVIRAPKKGDQVSSTTAKKSAVKKVVAKKAAPAKKVVAKKVVAKKAPAKKAPAKKVVVAPHRFPTKAELAALKVAREAEESARPVAPGKHLRPCRSGGRRRL